MGGLNRNQHWVWRGGELAGDAQTAMPCCVDACDWWQPTGLPPMYLLAGRAVCGTKLNRFLPNLQHFILRQQTGELYIVKGAG